MGLFNKKDLTSSAEVVDKHLILSLPNAIEPIVWRMELDKIGTASFEIKQTKNDNAYNLILKAKKGTAETIAPFNDKEQALDALIHASKALQRPEGINKNSNDSPVNNNTTHDSNSNTKRSNKWLFLFIGFLVVIALYIYMTNQLPNKINNLGSNTSQSLSSDNDPLSQTGVPLSADDFLNGL